MKGGLDHTVSFTNTKHLVTVATFGLFGDSGLRSPRDDEAHQWARGPSRVLADTEGIILASGIGRSVSDWL